VFSDKELQCKECGKTFVFTAGEQEFFAEKGFTNDPSRCPTCRAARKNNKERVKRYNDRPARQMYEVTCDSCGRVTQVPFQPNGTRAVYCNDCFRKNRWFA